MLPARVFIEKIDFAHRQIHEHIGHGRRLVRQIHAGSSRIGDVQTGTDQAAVQLALRFNRLAGFDVIAHFPLLPGRFQAYILRKGHPFR